MSNYDRQLIVHDEHTESQAIALNAKAHAEGLRSQAVRWDGSEVSSALRSLTGQSRLYLAGRSDWRAATLAGASPEQTADGLAAAQLSAVKLVSIVADELGRDSDSTDAERISEKMDSFAARFHARLKHHGILTTVNARVYRTAVEEAEGRKVTVDDSGDAAHHRTHSKLRFYWEGDQQKREWAY